MFKARIAAALFSVAFVGLVTVGAVRNLQAQQTNPGVQISGAVTFGHTAAFGPGVGQIQDGGAPAAVASVFGRIGAVVAAIGDYTFAQISGSLACSQTPALTGDITTSAGACATTLATVNANVGTFGSATQSASVTLDGKGRATAASQTAMTPAIANVTGLGAGVGTAAATALSAAGGLTSTIARGTSALGTGAIGSATCAATVTTAAANVLTTDVVSASFNGDPSAVTGYIPTTNGMLTILSYPTAGNVNFKVCNNTGASITPGAITLNWEVAR